MQSDLHGDNIKRHVCLRAYKALKSPRNKVFLGKSTRKEKAKKSTFYRVLKITRISRFKT